MPESWITDEMRAAIGTEYGGQVSFPIDANDIRRWAMATYYPEPPPERYWAVPADELTAAEDFNPFAWLTPAGFDAGRGFMGVEGSVGIEAPATNFMLNGGMECSYTGVPMKVGDVISSISRLANYTEREGKLGLMLFTFMETSWSNQRDELVKTQTSTLIRY